MLGKCFQGFPEGSADTTLDPMTSARAQCEHLSECYVAIQQIMNGEQYEWGSYEAKKGTLEESVKEMFKLREDAETKLFSLETDEQMQEHEGFFVGHDHYHIGQLVILHLSVDPQWDHYSIYSKE